MHRTLLLTSALAALPQVASADVAITGTAEMGLAYTSFSGPIGSSFERPLQFTQDIDVTFALSGESDNGVIFGAAVDLDEPAGRVGTDDFGVAIFISGTHGTLTMGDTDGAMDFAMIDAGDILNPGSLNDNETNYFGYRGSYMDGFYDGQILRYDVSLGYFSVAASVELNDRGTFDPIYGIGLRYDRDYGDITVAAGVGYQTGEFLTEESIVFERTGFAPLLQYRNPEVFGASGSVIWQLDGPIDSIGVGLQTARLVSDINAQGYVHHGVGLGLTSGAFSLHGNYGRFDVSSNYGSGRRQDWEFEGFGLSAGYDLGGGMSVLAGYGESSITRPGAAPAYRTESYSLGLSMTF